MHRRVPLILVMLVTLFAVPVVVAAAGPQLTATTVPGREIDVAGTGFPASADVLLAIQRNGSDDGTQTVQAGATGSFTATIDAGPGRGGSYRIVATSGPAKAVVQVVAVETAGAGGGVRPTPPNTAAMSPSVDPAVSWPIGAAVLALAVLTGLAVASWRVGSGRHAAGPR